MKVMKKDQENWKETLDEMNRALDEMRINYQRTVKLKNIDNAKNPLLERRMLGKANMHAPNQNNTIDVPDVRSTIGETDQSEAVGGGGGAKNKVLNILQESDGLLIANRKFSNASPNRFKRMKSMPNDHTTPLTVFYYSSTLNEPSDTIKADLFK
jgi:hypothetical protein